jgi:3-oxoacyl-[acyl-carrier protein] reductase
MAVAFAREGAHVALGYHSHETAARGVLAAIGAEGGQASLHRFDVRDRHATEQALDRIAAEHHGLDVVVNNAGIAGDEYALTMSDEKWHRVIDVNLTGTFNCARAAARLMLAVRSGRIINIASVAGLRASPGQVNYAAAKGGVVAMTRTLAAELGPYGVLVNAVVPGLIAAGMGERLSARIVAERQQRIPLGRLGTAEEVANVVVFVASERAKYIVGQTIVVDGGLSL